MNMLAQVCRAMPWRHSHDAVDESEGTVTPVHGEVRHVPRIGGKGSDVLLLFERDVETPTWMLRIDGGREHANTVRLSRDLLRSEQLVPYVKIVNVPSIAERSVFDATVSVEAHYDNPAVIEDLRTRPLSLGEAMVVIGVLLGGGRFLATGKVIPVEEALRAALPHRAGKEQAILEAAIEALQDGLAGVAP